MGNAVLSRAVSTREMCRKYPMYVDLIDLFVFEVTI